MGKLIANTGWQVAGKGITLLLSLVITGILTRRLGVTAYGGFVLITSIFVFLDTIGDFGTKIIGVREIVGSRERRKEQRQKFWQVVWLRLIMTGIAYGLGLGLVNFWPGLASIKREANIALLMIWLTSLAGNWEIICQARMRMDLKIVGDVVFPGIFLAMLWWFKGKVNLAMVFGWYLAARAISLAIEAAVVGGWGEIEAINKKIIKKIVRESWPMGLYLLIFTAYDQLVDSLMIGRMLGVRELGWYGLASKIYSNLIQPAYFLVVSLYPMLAIKNLNKKSLFWQAMGLMVGGAIGVIVVIGLWAPEIVDILGGKDFSPAVTVLRIQMIALFFAYIQHLVGFTLISAGKQKDLLVIGVMGLVFNMGMNWWLIPLWGITGGAVVTGMTEAVVTIAMGWRLAREGIGNNDKFKMVKQRIRTD